MGCVDLSRCVSFVAILFARIIVGMYVVKGDVVTFSGLAVGRDGTSSSTVGVAAIYRTLICHRRDGRKVFGDRNELSEVALL